MSTTDGQLRNQSFQSRALSDCLLTFTSKSKVVVTILPFFLSHENVSWHTSGVFLSFSGECKKSRQLRTVSHQRKSWCDEKGQEQKRQKGVICYERMLWFCGLKKRLITRTTNGFFWLLPKRKSQQRNLRELQKFRFFTFNLFSISLRNSFYSKKTCHEFFIQVYRILQYWHCFIHYQKRD